MYFYDKKSLSQDWTAIQKILFWAGRREISLSTDYWKELTITSHTLHENTVTVNKWQKKNKKDNT